MEPREPKRIASVDYQKHGRIPRQMLPPFGVAHIDAVRAVPKSE